MLSPYVQSQLVTKLVTTTTGKQFEVVFLISIIGGKVNARIVSAHPTQAPQGDTKTELALPSPKLSTEYAEPESIPTPFFADLYDELFFFTSQPTRAPAI